MLRLKRRTARSRRQPYVYDWLVALYTTANEETQDIGIRRTRYRRRQSCQLIALILA